jgi:hypothetical protein
MYDAHAETEYRKDWDSICMWQGCGCLKSFRAFLYYIQADRLLAQ